ncbi:unnamed protein product [Spodoptera littoralis]|uniref:THIF-type NAD/FAD binding fold domain-containing protein n=1 Tax=Spodoptera littoralis TaxID=7109 RepID=A0A9P0IAK8_SPOLI|nr:unnamed protein product [Spodoptera littoralis]CAH1642719.1 unnamed protein product [Spodoptera littoralis]
MEQLYILEKEIKELRQKLREKEEEMTIIRRELFGGQGDFRAWIPGQGPLNTSATEAGGVQCGSLPKWAIERYSRQILLKDIGVFGQTRICEAKVLIVGAGGLGCPSAMYLAAAGVGEIGIIDYDVVELTNIHRQVLHFEQDENVSKAESAASTLRSINSRIKVTPYNLQLDSKNATDIASQYDIILDCTDNVPTRYMLSDLTCFIKKPLISGSALKMEGQLTIYGYRSESHKDDKGTTYRGPCYRCVFPTPPSPDVVGSCSAHGVAGPVPGVIGILQAMEALKIILDMSPDKLLVERMLIFDAEDMTTRTVRLRKRNPTCATCSDNPTVTQLVDYEAYCSAPANDKKKHEARLRTERRIEEKQKRMTGQSYFGFRTQKEGTKNKWIQDVQKSERRLGPPCNSDFCSRSNRRYCKKFTELDRMDIFQSFWKLEWVAKKNYVRSLIDLVPIKRRRLCVKNLQCRKLDSKMYNLYFKTEKVQVCRVMFLNTLGIKEAMVRSWLAQKPMRKTVKNRFKSQNLIDYIDKLPIIGSKCQMCVNLGSNVKYININVKNQFVLYKMYVKDVISKDMKPVSRKTFSKVLYVKNLRIFKPNNDSDVCDLVKEHNNSMNFTFNDDYYQNVDLEGQWT